MELSSALCRQRIWASLLQPWTSEHSLVTRHDNCVETWLVLCFPVSSLFGSSSTCAAHYKSPTSASLAACSAAVRSPPASLDESAVDATIMVGKQKNAMALLAGTLLLLSLLAPAQQLDLTVIPDIALYPAPGPTDTGYPTNIPATLPTAIQPPDLPLLLGTVTSCPVTVGSVLTQYKRTVLAQLLGSTPLGQQILSGQMQATILAPPDAALTLALNSPGANKTLNGTNLALFHVLRGSYNMSDLSQWSGRYYSTAMTTAQCPTALSAVTMYTNNGQAAKAAVAAGEQQLPAIYARSADMSARFALGDIQACNSVVHILQHALQPCCVSFFELMPKFSIATPKPIEQSDEPSPTPGNTDALNRQLFEEALLDFMLFSNSLNTTRTILWPSAAAWNDFSLQAVAGSISDLTRRTQAMRLLALYALSYEIVWLPKDTPDPDGTAAAVQFGYEPALRKLTGNGVWACADNTTVSAAAITTPTLTPESLAGLPTVAVSSPSPSPSPLPRLPAGFVGQPVPMSQRQQPLAPPPPVGNTDFAAGAVQSQSASQFNPSQQQQPPTPPPPPPPPQQSTGSLGQQQQQQQTFGFNPVQQQQPQQFTGATAVNAQQQQVPQTQQPVPATQQQFGTQQQQQQQGAQPQPVTGTATGTTAPANPQGSQQQFGRRLAAAATGANNQVRVLDVFETCEGTRVLIIDSVLVPCGFDGLLDSYDAIDQQVETAFKPSQGMSVAQYYAYLKDTTGWFQNAAGTARVSGWQQQLIVWVVVMLLISFAWVS